MHRCRRSVPPVLACSWSVWRRDYVAPTGPGGHSRATLPVRFSTQPCFAMVSRTAASPRGSMMGLRCLIAALPTLSVAFRRQIGRSRLRSPIVDRFCSPSSAVTQRLRSFWRWGELLTTRCCELRSGAEGLSLPTWGGASSACGPNSALQLPYLAVQHQHWAAYHRHVRHGGDASRRVVEGAAARSSRRQLRLSVRNASMVANSCVRTGSHSYSSSCRASANTANRACGKRRTNSICARLETIRSRPA